MQITKLAAQLHNGVIVQVYLTDEPKFSIIGTRGNVSRELLTNLTLDGANSALTVIMDNDNQWDVYTISQV